MVRLAGIEPTTPWFVAKYSIQLSYSREGRILAEVAPRSWLLGSASDAIRLCQPTAAAAA